MKMYTLKRSQHIPRPLTETFSFFSRPENLALITPASLKFQMLTPPPLEMKEGAVIDYTIRPFVLALRWTTLITDFKPPLRFADLQLRGPYAYWHHAHTFTEEDDGTLMTDEIHYALPFGPFGRVVHALVVKHQLQGIFNHRKHALDEIFAQPARLNELHTAIKAP